MNAISSGCSAMVKPLTHHPKVEGSSPASAVALTGTCSRRHDFQHKDIQNNDTQHNGFVCDSQHNKNLLS